MEYSEALEADIADLEAAAIDLAQRTESGEVDATDKRHFLGVIDHIINSYPVSTEAVRTHAEHISRMYRNRTNDTTVRKRIATERQLFLREHCEEYDPQF